MNVAGLRSWLYVEGGNEAALARAGASGADVLIQELEDFTPPARRAHARTLSGGVLAGWRAAGKVAAVRVNPLHGDGLDDLEGIMPARPDVVMLPKVSAPEHVRELDAAVSRLERAHGIEAGRTALVPNVENAAGLMRTHDIVLASPRVVGAVVASEDMAADLGAERGPDAVELDYVRARFHVECTAAGVLSIDCPYTWSDAEGCERDTRKARRLGYWATAPRPR